MDIPCSVEALRNFLSQPCLVEIEACRCPELAGKKQKPGLLGYVVAHQPGLRLGQQRVNGGRGWRRMPGIEAQFVDDRSRDIVAIMLGSDPCPVCV
jgi:hypothetical protein